MDDLNDQSMFGHGISKGVDVDSNGHHGEFERRGEPDFWNWLTSSMDVLAITTKIEYWTNNPSFLHPHLDLAVGAPNSEMVYLYKTYPVIRINAYTQSLSRSISINQTKFQFRACWSLESTSNQTDQQPIKITLKVDPQVKRAFFSENINEMEFDAIAVPLPTCKIYDVMVKFSLPDIFKSIDIEIHYALMRKIPDSEGKFIYLI